MSLATNLKHLRHKRGLSQQRLGDLTKMTRSQIASYEQEIAQPSLESTLRLAKFFGVTMEDLLSDNPK